MPAATGMVADLAPENRRARWIGILSGGASFGWIVGPVLGGLLYDRWGFTTALLVSIGMAVVTLLASLIFIRETHSPLRGAASASVHLPDVRGSLRGLGTRLPKSMGATVVVLATTFVVMFAWALMEPRFMFYVYDDLGWSSSMLGLVMSVYGVALMLGEFGLSRLSDDLGRKPVIIIGLLLFSAQFLGLALSRDTIVIAVSFAIAGLGNSLYDPALSAAILDVTPAERQAQMLGIKSTAGSIGNILGPALIVLTTTLLQARLVFLISAGIVLVMMLIALLDLNGLKHAREAQRKQAAGAQAD
jgi:MFS family permease